MSLYTDVLADLSKNASGDKRTVNMLKKATVIHADNVMHYYAVDIEDEKGLRSQLGVQVPPFEHTWIEFTCPTTYLLDGEIIDWPIAGFRRAGVYMDRKDLKEQEFRWHIDFVMFLEFSDQVVRVPDGDEWNRFPVVLGEFELLADGTAGEDDIIRIVEQPLSMAIELRTMIDWARQIVTDVMLLSLSFLNCRNVSLESETPTARAQTAQERRRNIWPKPEHEFRTIHVNPFKSLKTRASAATPTGIHQRTHIVRGHFHTYTEERPLFGRPGLFGQFWIPQRLQGRADGAIEADYQIDVVE